jgi:hypothetical protein
VRPALIAGHVHHHAPGRLDGRGKSDPGAIEDVPLRCRDGFGTDMSDASLAGEFGKNRRCAHLEASLWVIVAGLSHESEGRHACGTC